MLAFVARQLSPLYHVITAENGIEALKYQIRNWLYKLLIIINQYLIFRANMILYVLFGR